MGCEHRSVPGCGGIGGAVPVGMGNPRSWWALGMGQGAAVSLAGQPAVLYRASQATSSGVRLGAAGFSPPWGCCGGGTPAWCPPGTTACCLQPVLAFPFPVFYSC